MSRGEPRGEGLCSYYAQPVLVGNAVIVGSLSTEGLSDALLGATLPEDTAYVIAEMVLGGAGHVILQALDINEDLSQDTSASCNALSAASAIGGVRVGPL